MAAGHEDEYMSRFWSKFSKDIASSIQARNVRDGSRFIPPSSNLTKASLYTIAGPRAIDLTNLPEKLFPGTVVVIENIHTSYFARIGLAWNIDENFFAEHASNPKSTSSSLWIDVFGTAPARAKRPPKLPATSPITETPPSTQGSRESFFWHVDAIVEYGNEPGALHDINYLPRRTNGDESGKYIGSRTYGLYRSSRISCYVTNGDSYLILVDAIPDFEPNQPPKTPPSVRLPVAKNRGGLVLGAFRDRPQYSLFDNLDQFLSHSWHFDALFPMSGPLLTPAALFHLIAASTWRHNLRGLDRAIKHIAFRDLRRPSRQINDTLHDRRHELTLLRDHVETTRAWTPAAVDAEVAAIRDRARAASDDQMYIGPPSETLAELRGEAVDLERFLMQTFNLLVSSTSVLEAEASLAVSARSQRLTALAFLYIPLSFVTGVFGMNLQEINGSPLPLWVFGVTLVAVVFCTALLFGLVWWREKRSVDRR